MQLIERPRAYVHPPTASLQLIYDLRLEVPKEAKSLSLFHVDERLRVTSWWRAWIANARTCT